MSDIHTEQVCRSLVTFNLQQWCEYKILVNKRFIQKGEKLACLTKIGGVFDQKFRLHRLLPRTDLLTWIPARMTSQLVVHRDIYIH